MNIAVTSSDESSVSIEPSTRPTTPELSPQLFAQPQDHGLHAQLAELAVQQNARRRNMGDFTAGEFPERRVVKKVCIVGAGYVGGPTAAVMALHNPNVEFTVVDKWQTRIRRWQSAHLPIHEPGLHEVVRIVRDGALELPVAGKAPIPSSLDTQVASANPKLAERRPNLFFPTDCTRIIAEADLIMLAVNTPTKTSGLGAGHATDLSALESAAREIATYAKPGAILVEKSTVPCGTADLIKRLLRTSRPGVPFEILSNPEFLSEGTAIKNLQSPDRVLIGSDNTTAGHAAAAALSDLYASWVPRERILGVNTWSSELAKLVANAMLAQRISSINSISALCEKTGADVSELAKAVGMDARIGPKFLNAGLGFGGSCFRKDISSLVYISNSLGLPEVGAYWQQVLSINEFQRQRFAKKVIERLNNTLNGKKISILGFAYKNNTGDTRESLAVDIIQILLDEQPTELAIYDPCCSAENIRKEIQHFARHQSVKVYTDPYAACDNASAICIITEWDMFKNTPPAPSSQGAATTPTQILSKQPIIPPPSTTITLSTNGASKSYFPNPEPDCEAQNCPDCQSKAEETLATPIPNSETRLDWVKIAHRMEAPRYVLDGRSVLDIPSMGKLGVTAEALGRSSGLTGGHCY